MTFEYTPTRPYWNTNSHPENGEVSKEWINHHYATVTYNRELTDEEILKYQMIPTYQLKAMVDKTFTDEKLQATIKILNVENFHVLIEGFWDGNSVGQFNQEAMEVWRQSKEWKQGK